MANGSPAPSIRSWQPNSLHPRIPSAAPAARRDAPTPRPSSLTPVSDLAGQWMIRFEPSGRVPNDGGGDALAMAGSFVCKALEEAAACP